MADEVRPLVATVSVTLQVVDFPAAEEIAPRFDILTTPPTSELAEELDGAAEWLGVKIEEILLAALGRALGRTRGEGTATVDVIGEHRWLFHTVSLMCSDAAPMGPTEMLQGAHAALAAAPRRPAAQAEILVNVAADKSDAAGDHALELRVRRADGMLHLDWIYDANRFDAYSIEEMAEQFPMALIEITSDAAAPL